MVIVDATRVRRVIEAVREYGPLLIEVGADLGKVYDFLRSQQSHPVLSIGELTELHRILDADVTKIGLEDSPATAPESDPEG